VKKQIMQLSEETDNATLNFSCNFILLVIVMMILLVIVMIRIVRN
jgi:hypothetical protein